MYYEYHNVVMKPDEQIASHIQNSWELNLVIIGSGVRSIGGRECAFNPGDMVLLPPGVEHQWIFNNADTDCDGRIHNISVMFSDEFINNLKTALPEIGETLVSFFSHELTSVFHGETRDKIEYLLNSMMYMTSEQRAIRMPELILMLCNGSDKETIITHQKLSEVERRAERLRIYCLCNYMRNIGISEAAGHIGMNKSSLCRFMNRHFGISFTGYVNNLRLEEACNMLKTTDKTVASIAYECGFNNITYFNKLFKEKFSNSPVEFRKSVFEKYV